MFQNPSWGEILKKQLRLVPFDNHKFVLKVYICQRGRTREQDSQRFGIHMCTLLYLKWIANKILLYSTGNSAQYSMTAWMGGESGGKRIHVYGWLSPFAIDLTLSQHC